MQISHLFILAQAAAPSPAAGAAPNPLLNFLPLIFIVVIFYFMLIRPQQKRQKEQQKMISAVKAGERVIMSSGIYGIVQSVKEKTVMVKVADNVKIEFDKASIATVDRSAPVADNEVKTA